MYIFADESSTHAIMCCVLIGVYCMRPSRTISPTSPYCVYYSCPHGRFLRRVHHLRNTVLRANWRVLHAALMDSSADEPLRPVEERGAPAAVLQATLMDTFTFMGVFSGGLMDNSTDESTLECTSAASWTF
jgi:hypothetical protein